MRKSNDDAIFRDNATADGKITLDKVSWCMPLVLPADAEKFQLYKAVLTLGPVPYRIIANRTRRVDFAAGLHSHY